MTKARRIELIAVLVIAGCATDEDRPPLQDLQPGMNLFETRADIAGAYVGADRAVFFETRRGPETVEAYRTLDANVPPYEMDVRILDQDGRTLYVRLGGDGFADPAWTDDFNRELALAPLDPVERAGSLVLVQEAMSALADVAVTADRAPEHEALVRAGTAIPDHAIRPVVETSYAPPYNYYELHRRTIYAYSGEHSATYLNVNGRLIENCNHGECADSMPTKCGGQGSAGAGYHEPSGSTGSVRGGCLTGYSLFSSGGYHNCHDDSVLQMRGMIWGGQDQYGGVCSNSNNHTYAPSCGVNSGW